MQIKFFARDVVNGVANNIGDEFTASFMGCDTTFIVTAIHGEVIMAVFA